MPITEDAWYRCDNCRYEGLKDEFVEEENKLYGSKDKYCCPMCGSENVSPDQE